MSRARAGQPLTETATEALRTAEADETAIRLTTQLPRKVYEEVDTVLRRLAGGGRWDRRARVHVFDQGGARDALAELLGDDPTAPVLMPEDADKVASFFRTPPWLADRMIELAGIAQLQPDARVLEPSAGDGAIAHRVQLARASDEVGLICVEPDPGRVEKLRASRMIGDVVLDASFEWYVNAGWPGADAIVMNPPFTVPGNATVWADHIALALGQLLPGGVLCAVAPNSYPTRTTRKVDELRTAVEQRSGRWIGLPDDTFVASGTSVRTGLIVVQRPEGEGRS